MNLFSAAVDFSTKDIFFSVIDDNDKIIIESSMRTNGRNSSDILPWLLKELDSVDLTLDDIVEWSCGTGPGSFTALRIIAALIIGITFGKNKKVRGVPTAIALVAGMNQLPENANIAVLYDGRRKEILCYDVRKEGKHFIESDKQEFPAVTLNDSSVLDEFDFCVAMSTDREAISKVISPDKIDNIIFFDKLPVAELSRIDGYKWGTHTLLNPVYLRPAVHVKPAFIRDLSFVDSI